MLVNIVVPNISINLHFGPNKFLLKKHIIISSRLEKTREIKIYSDNIKRIFITQKLYSLCDH